jgi:anti-sigma B factor antagonist
MDELDSQELSGDELRPPEHLTAEVRDRGLILTPPAKTIVDPGHIEALRREIAREVRRNPSRVYVLSLARVVFISSGFLGMLVTLAKKFRARQAHFRLCSVAPEIMQVFRASRMDRLLDVVADVETALKV